jgi:hypothetical protein
MGQYKMNNIGQMFKIWNKFCVVQYLVDKILLRYFRQFMQKIKNCPFVKWYKIILVFVCPLTLTFNLFSTKTFLKLNKLQLKLSTLIIYILACQTNLSSSICLRNSYCSLNKSWSQCEEYTGWRLKWRHLLYFSALSRE